MAGKQKKDIFEYDLLSPETLINPYPLYQRLRSEDPVHIDSLLGCWILTRYADIVTGMANPHFSADRISNERLKGHLWDPLRPFFRIASKQMGFSDPPDHTRVRSLFTKAFVPRLVETLPGRVQQIVDTQLDAVQEKGSMDIIQDLAYPLPVTVVADLLGIPREDHGKVKAWSDNFALFMGNPTNLAISKQAAQGMDHLMDYFRFLVSRRRANPQDDLLSSLIFTLEQEGSLDEEELFGNCVLLLFAGHETTTNLIGNGMLALFNNPDQLQLLQHQQSPLPLAIEELLRYDSPSQWTARLVKENTEIGGKMIGKGQSIMLLFGAANRDPDQFVEPDRLDITRRENRHLAFGYHRHYCFGAALARIEGRVAIGTLIHRFPSLKLATDTLTWKTFSSVRGLASLPVTL